MRQMGDGGVSIPPWSAWLGSGLEGGKRPGHMVCDRLVCRRRSLSCVVRVDKYYIYI